MIQHALSSGVLTVMMMLMMMMMTMMMLVMMTMKIHTVVSHHIQVELVPGLKKKVLVTNAFGFLLDPNLTHSLYKHYLHIFPIVR